MAQVLAQGLSGGAVPYFFDGVLGIFAQQNIFVVVADKHLSAHRKREAIERQVAKQGFGPLGSIAIVGGILVAV